MCWGTTGTAASFAPAGTSAAAIGSAGLVLGGSLLYLTGRGNRLRLSKSERWLLILGACAVAGYPVTFYPAVSRTGVAVATVIALGSAPVFAGLLSWLTGHGRPTRRWCLATMLAVIGCTLLVLGPQLADSRAHIDLVGVALAMGGGLTYAVYSLVGSTLIARDHPSNTVMGTMFGLAALLVLPVVLASGPAWLAAPRGLAVALHLALFTTFLAYRLFGYGLRHTTVETATTLTLAEPAVAALLGIAVLGERLPTLSWVGLAILAVALAALAG
ncbi:carboxylate/amino acid/amine transporter [Nocardia heshunensis]